jgi:predicted hotdog family 3-hydroxylacyl-ACP dehydratase
MRPVHVHSVGLFAPGFADARAFVEGRRDDGALAPRDVLPARARRGTTLATRMMADVAAQATEQAGFDPGAVRTVYASAYGETATSVALLEMLHGADGAISPARFATSVHNAASGLVSIAAGNRAFSTAVAAGSATVAMGLLEAAALLHADPSPTVVVFADEPVPEALSPDLGFEPLAVAFGLSGDPAGALATIVDVQRMPRAGSAPAATSHGNPAAAALPLLRAVLAGGPATVALEPEGGFPWSAAVVAPPPVRAPYPPIRELVPHRPPMLLLDEVLSWEAGKTVCLVVLRDDSPFVEAGRVPPMVAVEYMAQCVAASAGLRGNAQGEPVRIGYLVGAREIVLPAEPFRVGDVLHVEASHVWGDDTLGNFQCSVERRGEVVARATLNVYRGDLQPAQAGRPGHAGPSPTSGESDT